MTLRRRTGLKRTGRLSPISDRRRRRDADYRAARTEVFLRADGMCEMFTPACSRVGVEAHHVRGRVGRLLTDTEWLMWVCRECHDYAHAHPAVSYEKGWLVRRNGGGDAA